MRIINLDKVSKVHKLKVNDIVLLRYGQLIGKVTVHDYFSNYRGACESCGFRNKGCCNVTNCNKRLPKPECNFKLIYCGTDLISLGGGV